jgi:hypothetical protein
MLLKLSCLPLYGADSHLSAGIGVPTTRRLVEDDADAEQSEGWDARSESWDIESEEWEMRSEEWALAADSEAEEWEELHGEKLDHEPPKSYSAVLRGNQP